MSSINLRTDPRQERLKRASLLVWLRKVEQRLTALAQPDTTMRSRMDILHTLIALAAEFNQDWLTLNLVDQQDWRWLNESGLIWRSWSASLTKGQELPTKVVEDWSKFFHGLVTAIEPKLTEVAA